MTSCPATFSLLTSEERQPIVEAFLNTIKEEAMPKSTDSSWSTDPNFFKPKLLPMRIDPMSLEFRENVDIDEIDVEILPLPIDVDDLSNGKTTRSLLKPLTFTAKGRLTSDRAACPYCGKEYANLDSLRKHAKSIHGVVAAVCNICNEFFTDKQQRIKHFQSQLHKLRNEEFNRRTSRENNRRVSEDKVADEVVEEKKEEKPMVVDVSLESLEQQRQSENLMVDAQQQPFHCPLCPSKRFKSSKQMKRHYMLEHPKTPFKICVHCNKAFTTLTDFQRHKREEVYCMDPLREDSMPFRGFQPQEGKELEGKLRLLKQLLANT